MQIDRQKAKTSFISLVILGLLSAGAIWWWQSGDSVESGSYSQSNMAETRNDPNQLTADDSVEIDEETLADSQEELVEDNTSADDVENGESDSDNATDNSQDNPTARIVVEDDLSWLDEKGLPGMDALISDLQTNNNFEITLK